MSATADLSPTDRYSSLIEGLMKDVEASVVWGWVAIPLIKLLWRQLRRMKARFASVLARFRAGTLPAPGSARRDPAPAPAFAEAKPLQLRAGRRRHDGGCGSARSMVRAAGIRVEPPPRADLISIKAALACPRLLSARCRRQHRR